MRKKERIGRRIISILLSLVMMVALLPATSLHTHAAEAVSYIDRSWDEADSIVRSETKSVTEYTVVTADTTAWSDGWYVVNSDVTIEDRVTVSGTVHLILTDGYTLTAETGVTVNEGNSLTIYGQGRDTGTLNAPVGYRKAAIGGEKHGGTITIDGGTVIAQGGYRAAGIGGGAGGAGGTITINGGNVTVRGGYEAAGIGGGVGGAGGTITIHGGTVTARSHKSTGWDGAGIGGGMNGAGGTITITGGTVNATGDDYGAGIGGGFKGAGGTITITGGTVNATSEYDGAGIGGGYRGTGETITITGGTVTATGNNDGAGIGGGTNGAGGTVTITGGNVKAASSEGEAIGKGYNGSSSGTLTDGKDNVYLHTVTIDGGSNRMTLASIDGAADYGLKDVSPLDTNKYYFYLPADSSPTGLTTGDGGRYEGTMSGDSAKSGTFYCVHVNQTGSLCLNCGAVVLSNEPVLNGDGFYEITSIEELYWFRGLVNGTLTDGTAQNVSANAVLMKDLDISAMEFLGIGTSTSPYAGIFDGNGKTLTVSLYGGSYTAPFGFVNGGVIRNLTVDGEITASGMNGAGIVSRISGGNAVISNCISSVDIISTVNGDGTHGGLVGVAASGSLTIENSAFTGSLSGRSTANCGGLVGWASVDTKINHSYVSAEFDISSASGSNTFSRNPEKVTLSNCYYLNELTETPSGAVQKEAAAFADGEVAYLLNGSVGGGTDWYQNLNNGQPADTYPVPDSTHGAVYYCYADCESTEMSYSNQMKTVSGHVLSEATCMAPAICQYCGQTFGEKDPDNHTETDTYFQLIDDNIHGKYHSCCDALIEKSAHQPSIEATCTGVAHCEVCQTSYGETDAANHTRELEWVDNGDGTHIQKWSCCGLTEGEAENHVLSCKGDEETDTISVTCDTCKETGTVTMTVSGATYIGQTYTADYTGQNYTADCTTTGILAGRKPAAVPVLTYCCEDGCSDAGDHKVTMTLGNAKTEADFTITPKTLTIDMVAAFDKSYDGTARIDLYSISVGGIVVYSYGSSDMAYDDVKDNVAVDYALVTAELPGVVPGEYTKVNLANVKLKGKDAGNYVIESSFQDVPLKSSMGYEFRISDRMVWISAQDQYLIVEEALDQTAYTVEGLPENFELSGVELYENEYGYIDIKTDGIIVTYQDDIVTDYFEFQTLKGNITRVCEGHETDENGFCSTGECDTYEAALINDNGTAETEDDDYYEIYNAGQLYWFAEQVNDYGKSAVGVKLMDNITVNTVLDENARKWEPINNYYGNFNGNGMTVSGLYCVPAGEYAGFFGYLGTYPVSDLHIKNSYFEGTYAGAITGYAQGELSLCSAGADVTVKGSRAAGGLAGDAVGIISNCYSQATVSGDQCVGGLVGTNAASISNCYTSSDNVAYTNNTSYGGSFQNVYYLAESETDEFDGTTAMTAEQFESGEAAYLLQEAQVPETEWSDEAQDYVEVGPAPQIWGQNIDLEGSESFDEYPVLGGPKVSYGYPDCKAAEMSYSNKEVSSEIVQHIYTDGYCKECGASESAQDVTEVFTDVAEGKWYVDCVQYVYDEGLMSGNNGVFNPTGNVTRAQIVSTLYKLAGSPEVTDYSACDELVDVEADKWYTDAVCWAYSTGVGTGNTTTMMFNMNNPVTRQQLATFFYRYAEYKGLDTTATGDFSSMLNADQVSSYATEAVTWAVGAGLITGKDVTDGEGNPAKDLAPRSTATRAQLAAILQRFCEGYGI